MKRELIRLFLCAVILAAITTSAGARPIKVLHVSEVMQSEVQAFIDDAGANSRFDVTQVSYWDEYHWGPPKNLEEYDVIVFGLSDCFDVVRDLDELVWFVGGGGGVMFTHDSASNINPPAVKDMVGVGEWIEDNGTLNGWIWGNSAEIIQDHAVLHYPFEIGNVGENLEIQPTHTVVTLDSGDKILKLPGPDQNNNWYLAVKEYGAGRVVVSQVGHSVYQCGGEPGDDPPVLREQQLFVNCLFWASRDVRNITVPGTACCFFAGQDQATLEADYPPDPTGAGDHDNFHNDTAITANTMPPSIEVSGWSKLSISAEGLWGHDPGSTSGPNGVPGLFSTVHDEYEDLGIPRVISAETNKLIGIFLTDNPPDPQATPANLTFGIDDMTNPKLQQAFAIGADLADITIPEGATRLFFGLQDGCEWNNNVGSVEVTCEIIVKSRSEVASYPYPADGATVAGSSVTLLWIPGFWTTMHDVYFGTDYHSVNDAKSSSGAIYRGRQVDTNYTIEELVVDQTYYWRVDEVEADGWTIHKGDVWSFTVADIITIESQVSSSEDDGYASNDSLQNLSADYLRAGFSSFGGAPYYMSGMVFRNVNITQGTEIISARLKIYSHDNRLDSIVYGKIEAEAADDAASLGWPHNIGSLSRTSSSVNWDHYEPWEANMWYESPNIAGVIQEVIDRVGWSPNNALTILYSTRDDDGGYRNFSSYDRGSEYAPILEMTYIP